MKLVTGSKGFIASHYMELHPNCRGVDIDYVIPYVDSEGITEVIHFGALTSAAESINNPSDYWFYNVLRTQDLFSFYDDLPFFFASSAAVYKPLNPYALTKCVVEEHLKGKNNVSVGRFFNVFGERDEKSVIYHFIKAALQNEPLVIYGDGSATRDFIYVKDLVLNIKHDNLVKDIGYGESFRIDEIAAKIISLTDSKSSIIFKDKRNGDPQSTVCAKDAIDYMYGLETGLKRMIEWVDLDVLCATNGGD